MAIDPRGLRTFLMVVRESSFSGAARRLFVSQPAVSVTITQLERGLGVKLLNRARAGVTPTLAGEALVRRAEALEQLLETAEQEASLYARGISGPLRIGGTPGALATLLPPSVRLLAERNPRFAMQVLERPESGLLKLLRTGKIEFAVVTSGIDPVPEDIQEETLSRDPFDLIAGPSNAHLPSPVALSDVRELGWVLPDVAGSFRRQVDALFIASAVKRPDNVIHCDSLQTTKNIVRTTGYVALLPRTVAEPELSMGLLRAIPLSGAPVLRSVGVRVLRERALSPIAAAFVEAMRTAVSVPRS